ncbi:hypothetical protein [Marinibacterium sp. SX1]|uniref:hypothetical protein n=1 Tax=Marinibacterium sp. SX1 TaxID=3388424 RepID=UPI003D176A56
MTGGPDILSAAVPVDVTLNGRPDARAVTDMQGAVTAAVLDQLAELRRELGRRGITDVSRDVLAPRIAVDGDLSGPDREALTRALTAAVNAAIAESGIAMRPRSVRMRGGAPRAPARARPGPPARIARRASLVMTVAQFTEFFATYGTQSTDTLDILRALYGDRAEDEITVTTRVAQINQPLYLDAVGEWLAQMALRDTPEGMVAFWVYTSRNDAPARMADMGRDSQGDFSALTHPLSSTRTLPDGTAVVLPGAQVFFASAALPRIELETVLDLLSDTPLAIEMPVRELDFLADHDSFERLLGVPWADYVREFGDDPAELLALPFEIRAQTHHDAVNHLMQARVAAGLSQDTAFFGATRILGTRMLDSLPSAARARLGALTNAQSRAVTDADQFGTYRFGWRGAYLHATFRLSDDQRERALYRPAAAAAADRLAGLIRNADPHDIEWLVALVNAFFESFGSSASRGQVALFDLTLDELDRRGLLEGLFSVVERARYYSVHAALVRYTTAGRYADHPLAVATRELLNRRAREIAAHDYDIARNVMLLDGHPRRIVAADGVVGDLSDRYVHEVEGVELRPAALVRLKDRAQVEADRLAADILSGRDTGDYTSETFVRTAIVRAAEALDLGEDAFHEVVKQTSARFHGVERVIEGGIERTYVTWSLVTRNRGERGWREVEGSRRRELAGYFHETLALWRIMRGFEGLRTLALVVGIGTVAIVGVVFLPELIAVAGGLKVVLASIAISELIYFATVIFTDVEFSWEGVALAALDGYLFALGFRFGGVVASGLSGRILSTGILSTLGRARLAQLAVRGAVGGGSTGFLVRFAHDIYDIGTGQRNGLSSLGDYALHVGFGTVLGVAGELAVNAAITRVLAGFAASVRAGSVTAIQLAEVAERLGAEGVSFARFAAESLTIVDILGGRLGTMLDEAIAGQLVARFRQVLDQIRAHYPAALQTRRLVQGLELIDLQLGAEGLAGLERLILIGGQELDGSAALALVRQLRAAGAARSHGFFTALGLIDDAALRGLTEAGGFAELLQSERALAYALDASDLFGRLLNARFRFRVDQLDSFLAELEDLTVDPVLRRRIIDVLLDAPDLPMGAVLGAVERLGALNPDAVLGLASLFRSTVPQAELVALVARSTGDSLPRLLALARGLGPQDMTAMIDRGMALAVSRSAGATRMLDTAGWTRAARILDDRFAGSVAPMVDFADRAAAAGLSDDALRNLLSALADNGSYSNEGLMIVAERLGDVSPGHAGALGSLFDLVSEGFTPAAIEQMIARQAAVGAEPLTGLLSLPNVLRADLAEAARRGALEPLARSSGVVANIRGARVRRDHFFPLLDARPGGPAPDPARVIDALERLLRSHPGTRLNRISPNIISAGNLPRSDAQLRAGVLRPLATEETLEALNALAGRLRLGTDVFTAGGRSGSGTVDAVELAARLVGDNVDPRTLRTILDIATPNLTEIARPPGTVRVEFAPAARGGLRPDLSVAFLDASGRPVGLAGREVVTVSPDFPPGLDPAATRAHFLRSLRASVHGKAQGVPTNGVANRASAEGLPVAAQELEVQVIRRDASQLLDVPAVEDMLGEMQRFGQDALFNFVDRVRFYDISGNLRVLWSNPARGGAGVVEVAGGAP